MGRFSLQVLAEKYHFVVFLSLHIQIRKYELKIKP